MARMLYLAAVPILLGAALLPAVHAAPQETKDWIVTATAVESPPGWFQITATGTNATGRKLYHCQCQIEVKGGLAVESKNPIDLDDVEAGGAVTCKFVLRVTDGVGGQYRVTYSGLTNPRPR